MWIARRFVQAIILLPLLIWPSVHLSAWSATLSPSPSLTMRFLWLFIGAFAAVVVHEAGHLICALASGELISRVAVGGGPLLVRRRFNETLFELRLVPLLGFVMLYPRAKISRTGRALVYAGGALGNALALAVVAVVFVARPDLQPSDDMIGPVVFMQLLFLANLIPFRTRLEGVPAYSDGLQLLRLLWLSAEERTKVGRLREQLLGDYAHGQPLPPFTPASARILYQVLRRDRFIRPDARDDFVAAMLRELDRGLPPPEAALVIDALVFHALSFDDVMLRSRLDALTLRAVALLPAGTPCWARACVLAELGRHREAKQMIEAVLLRIELDPNYRFPLEVQLARAEHALGNEEAAHRWAAAARQSAAGNPLATTPMLARLDADLAAADDRG